MTKHELLATVTLCVWVWVGGGANRIFETRKRPLPQRGGGGVKNCKFLGFLLSVAGLPSCIPFGLVKHLTELGDRFFSGRSTN